MKNIKQPFAKYLFVFLPLLFLIAFSCNQKSAEKILISTDNGSYAALCTPTPPDLNTKPGFDGHLSPLFEGLDVYHYPITTENKQAQRYFDQGFILNYGFNHAESARSFREVTQLDPTCAMGYWGLAYVLGPNYNAPMFPDVFGAAKEAVAKANLYAHKATPKEQALIKALSKRYPPTKEEDPAPYYEAYANSMKAAMHQFPNDLDIAAMTAESLMDLHPWDLYEKNGTPKEWTPEITNILESVLAKDPHHPQALHLYIHATEASNNPEKALYVANNLRHRVPGAGHLVHMPSHLYINTGHYHEGTLANERAVQRDSHYLESCAAAGIYPLALYPHNWHFLAACAALEGDGDKAIYASRFMANHTVDRGLMYEKDWVTLQHFYSIPWYIMVKFAKWDDILKEPNPDPQLIYPSAIYAYAQAMAFIHKGNKTAALEELKVIEAAEKDTSIANFAIWDINKMTELITIAKHVVKAHLATKEGNFDVAETHYLKAIEVEDRLNYSEPPDWFFSVRHHYGDVLLKQDKYEEAVAVYNKDLETFPKNGYALKGLEIAYQKQGKKEASLRARQQFNVAWQWATVALESSVVQ